MQVGDIVKHHATGNHLLILSKTKVIIDKNNNAYAYRYRCLDLFSGGHKVSFLPKGLYKKMA